MHHKDFTESNKQKGVTEGAKKQKKQISGKSDIKPQEWKRQAHRTNQELQIKRERQGDKIKQRG